MNLDIEDGMQLIGQAVEKREEDRAWQMWLCEYPHMNKDTFLPFSEYFGRIRAPVITSTKPKEQLYAELNALRNEFDGSPTPES